MLDRLLVRLSIFSKDSAQKLARPTGEYLLFTLVALLTTLPVIVYHFQRLALSALIANPLILPAQPAVMVLGGLTVVLGMIYQPLGQTAATLAWPLTAHTIRVVEAMAQVPGGVYRTGPVGLTWVFLYYGVLMAVTFAWGRLRRAGSVTARGGRCYPAFSGQPVYSFVIRKSRSVLL